MLLVLATIPVAHAYLLPPAYEACPDYATDKAALEDCYDVLLSAYTGVFDMMLSESQKRADIQVQLQNTTSYYEAEVQLWKAKYTALLSQQGGNSTMQDQIANLTARVDAVETKAATNESLIYIIQNMLRTVQTDIADIFLKINSVR